MCARVIRRLLALPLIAVLCATGPRFPSHPLTWITEKSIFSALSMSVVLLPYHRFLVFFCFVLFFKDLIWC